MCVQYNSRVMASSSADSTIRVWDYLGQCQSVLEGHIGVVRCLCLHGDRLISGGDRKRVVIWDVKVHYIVLICTVVSYYHSLCIPPLYGPLQSGTQLHTVHRQQSLLHRMCVTDTQIITASPDSPGTISIISYW